MQLRKIGNSMLVVVVAAGAVVVGKQKPSCLRQLPGPERRPQYRKPREGITAAKLDPKLYSG